MARWQARADRRAGPWLGLLLAALVLLAGAAALVLAQRDEPLAVAWRAVQAVPDYSATGSTTTRWSTETRRSTVSARGRTTGRLTLVRPDGGSLDIAWPDVRTADGRTLEPRAVAAILPLGDPLALLAAAHGGEPAGTEWIDGRACQRVDFLVGGRAYQTWWEQHRAYLPFNADAGGMTTFSARGTAWLDPATHLPCRIRAQADMPRTPGELRGSAEVDWLYTWPAAAP